MFDLLFHTIFKNAIEMFGYCMIDFLIFQCCVPWIIMKVLFKTGSVIYSELKTPLLVYKRFISIHLSNRTFFIFQVVLAHNCFIQFLRKCCINMAALLVWDSKPNRNVTQSCRHSYMGNSISCYGDMFSISSEKISVQFRRVKQWHVSFLDIFFAFLQYMLLKVLSYIHFAPAKLYSSTISVS